MKNLRFIIAAFAFLVFTAYANAQTAKAILTEDGTVRVNNQEPLQSAYTLDASNFNFETEQEALAYFADRQSQYVSYRPVLQNNIIMVYLQTKTKPEWTKSDWNTYLAKNKIKGEVANPSQQLSK